MTRQTDSTSDAMPTLAIEGELDVYHAAEWHAALCAAFEGNVSLALDLHDVTELDSAGVQLLLAARRTARERNGALLVTRASRSVCDVFATSGIDALFANTLPMQGISTGHTDGS